MLQSLKYRPISAPTNTPQAYPFGSVIHEFSYKNVAENDTARYRYGFNNQEQDGELGEFYAFEYRVHDARLGRFLSVDPYVKDFSFYSPYHFCSNNPIVAIDLDGLEAVVVITGIVVNNGEASNYRGQYFMYQVNIYECMTYEQYQDAYKNGTLKVPDATTTVARDAWANSSNRSPHRYGQANETPPGVYRMTYSPAGYGSKKYNIKISDNENDDKIEGPDGVRLGIRWHHYSPHYSAGCFTTGDNNKNSVYDNVLSKIPSLVAGLDVWLIVEPRDAAYNKSRRTFDGLNDKPSSQGQEVSISVKKQPIYDWNVETPKNDTDNTYVAPSYLQIHTKL